MAGYILNRVLYGVITLFLVATATFALMRMVPGGPFLAEKAPSAAVTAALEKKYGMDKPVIIQYFTYLTNALHGDLGPSIKQRGRTVTEIIKAKFPVSAKLGGMSVLIALVAGVPLGCIAAYKRGSFLDRLVSVYCATGVAVPNFVVCTLMMYFLGVKCKLLPTMGLSSPVHYIIPLVALSMLPTAYVTRLSRSSMLEVTEQDFMRTARAKGVSATVSIFKHALRNAIIPVVTYVGPLLAYLVTGSMVVEKMLVIPGLGSEFVSSILNRDYPMIMGTTIFLAALLIGMSIVVDILYKIIDPRIKLN